MIGWVRPQILIPVHGEALHMAEHAALARRAGVGKVLAVPQRRSGAARAGRPGDHRRGAGRPPLQGRRAAGRAPRSAPSPIAAGWALPAWSRWRWRVTRRASWSADPEIELTGIPEADAHGHKLEDIAYDAAVEAFGSMPRARRRDPDAVAEAVRRAVRAALGAAWNKKPIVPRACARGVVSALARDGSTIGAREVTVLRPSLCLATALLAGVPGALAQDYPTRFITIVAPFQAGGPSDTVARLIAGPMSKVLGQQVVVENVTGAGGTIGSGRVAKAAPDGYTLGISGSGTHAAVEQLYANPPYRALDFEVRGAHQHGSRHRRCQEGPAAEHAAGIHRLSARQREVSDRGRCGGRIPCLTSLARFSRR